MLWVKIKISSSMQGTEKAKWNEMWGLIERFEEAGVCLHSALTKGLCSSLKLVCSLKTPVLNGSSPNDVVWEVLGLQEELGRDPWVLPGQKQTKKHSVGLGSWVSSLEYNLETWVPLTYLLFQIGSVISPCRSSQEDFYQRWAEIRISHWISGSAN